MTEQSAFDDAAARWRQAFDESTPDASADPSRNRSGIPIQPLYTPDDWNDERYLADLGFPGQGDMTRGVYPSMHRGRRWTQRQIVGFGLPEHYNARQRAMIDAGVTGVYLSPCNSHMRGFDADTVPRELLGISGTLINTIEDLETAFDGIDIGRESMSLGDCAPYTLAAFVLELARRRGVPWRALAGTSNQSDYLSHYVACQMFFRLALPGARRLLLDHIAFMNRHVPRWNGLSIVGQHIQQAGATPAEAMALALCSALQYADDLIAQGGDPDRFLPRFSFFFDISISFFEEVAKFRAGRRLWARLVRARLGAKDPAARKMRFHAQTSGVDLTRQQPLNNISRVAVQAMAGIFGGLQSLHTDAYDEAFSAPSAQAARTAISTQNILADEAHLDQVIDPLGGSYYVETLTNDMEARMEAVVDTIDQAGGMYRAAEAGLVQDIIGRSALAAQDAIEAGRQTVVGVNAYQVEDAEDRAPELQPRLTDAEVDCYLARLDAFKQSRDTGAVTRALDAIARAAATERENVFAAVVDAAAAGATHGEMVGCLRGVYGEGAPRIAA